MVFVGTCLAILAGIFGATTKEPTLLKRPEQLPSAFSDSILDTAHRVDEEFAQTWDEKKLTPAPLAPWHAIARRVSLGMVGNGLSLEEYRLLEQLPESERIAWWTEYLLRDRRWADHFAERWARATVGTVAGPFLVFRRRKYTDWLADQFQENLPYDQLVKRLLTAKGSWTDSPEVNFYTVTLDENDPKKPDEIRLAGRTSRTFLAMRIDCLQCHNDYLGNVKFTDQAKLQESKITEPPDTTKLVARTGQQSDFHQLAAYFGNVRMDNPFSGVKEESIAYRFKYLNADKETEVRPTVPFDRALCNGEGTSRQALADWITHPKNRPFARATVNRVWAILFGKPLVIPIDDIPATGPYPPGLETLADDFIEHGYDLQRLVRVIIATRAFQIDSRWSDVAETSGDDPTIQGTSEGPSDRDHELALAIFPLSQLRPEQMAASVHQACRLKTIDASSSILSQLELFGGINDFTQAYGGRGDDEFAEQPVTVPQRLLMMNGKFLADRIDNNPIMNAATRIAGLAKDDATAVQTAFISTLNRPASDDEQEHFRKRLEGKRGENRSRELGNLFWVLLNSSEFQWNH